MNEGIFDKEEVHGVAEEVAVMDEKQDFTAAGSAGTGDSESQEASIMAASAALNKSMEGGDSTEVSDKDMAIAEITDEEEELAEEMLFRGFAETKVPLSFLKKSKHYITICTTSPQEVSLVNEIMFNILKSKSDQDGNVQMPEIEISTLKNAYMLALAYEGINGDDICEEYGKSKLKGLKKAIKTLNDLHAMGKIKEYDEMSEQIVDALRKRVSVIKRVPSQILDFIGDSKYNFDTRMYEIMSGDSIFPK